MAKDGRENGKRTEDPNRKDARSIRPQRRDIFQKIAGAQPGTKFAANAEGGAGKGSVIETLLLHFRLRRKICLATGTSGQAASLLPGGTTLHAAIGLELDGTPRPQEERARGMELLRAAHFIAIDEVFVAHPMWLQMLDARLSELGAFPVVLYAGDSCQIGPVDDGTDETYHAMIQDSHPIEYFEKTTHEPLDLDVPEGEKNPRFATLEYGQFCSRLRVGGREGLDLDDDADGTGNDTPYRVTRTEEFDCRDIIGDIVGGNAEPICGTHYEKDTVARLGLEHFRKMHPRRDLRTYTPTCYCYHDPTRSGFGAADLLTQINTLTVAEGMPVALTRNMTVGEDRLPKESRGVVRYLGERFVSVKFALPSGVPKTVAVPFMPQQETSHRDGGWRVTCIPLRVSWASTVHQQFPGCHRQTAAQTHRQCQKRPPMPWACLCGREPCADRLPTVLLRWNGTEIHSGHR